MEVDAAERRRTLIQYIAGILASCIVLAWILSPNTAIKTPAATAAAVKHHRIPVYYWHMWSGEWLPVMDHVCDEFNASQDKYEVIPLQIPYAESDQKFLLAVAGGNPPDLMAQWSPAITAWAQSGILEPLDQRMTPAEHNYFMYQTYPVVHENGWYKGHLYGLLINFDVYACYYRTDLFKQAGLNPNQFPTTMEELNDDGMKLNQTDSSGRLTRIGFLPTMFSNFLPSYGGGLYDPLTPSVQVLTPPNLRAMQFIVDAHKKLGFDRVVRFNSGFGNQDTEGWPFITGQFAVTLDGEWRVQQLAKYAPKLQYKVAMLPPPAGGVPDASFSSSDFMTIPSGAKHADGAWAFIKFWEGIDHPAQAAKYKISFGWLPASPEQAAAPDYQKYLKLYPQYKTFVQLAASKHIVSLPPIPYAVFLQDKMTADDDLAERGVLTATRALVLLQHQVSEQEQERKALGYAR
jgi:multiple sugar transport system substrate-binding protein